MGIKMKSMWANNTIYSWSLPNSDWSAVWDSWESSY